MLGIVPVANMMMAGTESSTSEIVKAGNLRYKSRPLGVSIRDDFTFF